jgi:hypothetical protein
MARIVEREGRARTLTANNLSHYSSYDVSQYQSELLFRRLVAVMILFTPPFVATTHNNMMARRREPTKNGTRSVLVKFLGAHASQILKYYPATSF